MATVRGRESIVNIYRVTTARGVKLYQDRGCLSHFKGHLQEKKLSTGHQHDQHVYLSRTDIGYISWDVAFGVEPIERVESQRVTYHAGREQ